ncbi:hypothetical protein [Actinomadura sp. B10D3]|uniref:hypothetical protein n=1 Tax=Actinomadura sp. B10D3 TaxID=3153557 RepID=UPI00325D7447
MALATVAAVLLNACSSDEASDTAPSPEPTGAPAVGVDESFRVLSEWTDRHNDAITSGDVRVWREAVTGALEAPVSARVRVYGELPASARISLANPVLYVPRQSRYPKWFGMAALERSTGKDQQVLGVFVKTDAKARWRAAHWLTFQGAPPDIASDRQGYAISAPDRGLPSVHARYLADGDESGVVPDAYSADARTKRYGDWTGGPGKFTPGTGPSYALRTKDGGSLVWYGLKQEITLTGGDASTLPAELRDHLAKAAEEGEKPAGTLRTTWQWLVIGYAPPSGKRRVLGESVSLVSAR